jgi:hypothetical protein
MRRYHIRFRVSPALALAGAAFLVAGCGGAASASVPGSNATGGTAGAQSRHAGAVEFGSAAPSGGAVARWQGTMRRAPKAARRPGPPPPGEVRLTRTGTVTMGGAGGGPGGPSRTVPCAPPGLPAAIHLCPPGFWRLYRLSISAGHHPPALFLFPSGCGAAGKARATEAPATPRPLAISPG